MVQRIFQARLYDIRDDLTVKRTFTEQESAEEFMFGSFSDPHNGLLCARGVIRTADPSQGAWRCLWATGNPHAVFLDPATTVIDRWRLSLYDRRDLPIESFEVNTITEQGIEARLISLNAFCAVLSGHEPKGPPDDFWVCSLYLNAWALL